MRSIARGILLALFFSLQAFCQLGTIFPLMNCENLDGKPLAVPTALVGKKSLICLAYSQKAETKLQAWLDAVIPKFVMRTSEQSLIPEEPYDVHTFFIPMYTGAAKSFADKSVKQIKNNVDVLLHPYLLIYKGELEPYKSKLLMSSKDDPYIFILDEKGKIIYACKGAYTAKAMDEIEDLISE